MAKGDTPTYVPAEEKKFKQSEEAHIDTRDLDDETEKLLMLAQEMQETLRTLNTAAESGNIEFVLSYILEQEELTDPKTGNSYEKPTNWMRKMIQNAELDPVKKEDMLRYVGHDMDNVLTELVGSMDMALYTEMDNNKRIQRYIDSWKRYSLIVEGLIARFVDEEKVHPTLQEKAPITEVFAFFERLEKVFSEKYGIPLELEIDEDARDVVVKSNQGTLVVAFWNCINNVVSRLDKIRATKMKFRARVIPFGDTNTLELSLHDDGTGFTKELLAHPFEKGVSGNATEEEQAKGHGHGIGLSAVNTNIESMGGTVQITSVDVNNPGEVNTYDKDLPSDEELTKGTTFTFTFPEVTQN